jgi:hypothetical protein
MDTPPSLSCLYARGIGPFGPIGMGSNRSFGPALLPRMVAVLAAGIALLVGEVAGSEIVLYIAMGPGVATAIPLVLPEPGPAA